MKYIIANKAKAADVGFEIEYHRTKGNQIMLNEKEVMSNAILKGTKLKERAEQMDGTVCTEKQALTEINNGGWK